MAIVSRHLIISGRVQGVSYRAWAEREANRRGLHGWVRNRRDGTVEAVIHGPEENVNALIENAWSGPILAKVENIEINDAHYDGADGFETRPTV